MHQLGANGGSYTHCYNKQVMTDHVRLPTVVRYCLVDAPPIVRLRLTAPRVDARACHRNRRCNLVLHTHASDIYLHRSTPSRRRSNRCSFLARCRHTATHLTANNNLHLAQRDHACTARQRFSIDALILRHRINSVVLQQQLVLLSMSLGYSLVLNYV